ncbi:MAG TPA: hypothetical protein VK975_00670 [Acidimicrobiales bacterium]|nr:hypothetical protein [Acidimicrobiales bacterium]
MASIATTVALSVTWDPTIRGILVVLVAVAVLMGSGYVVLSTNLGVRLGFLVAAAAFWGWMTIMGLAWWAYGIGLKGPPATWHVEEVLTSARPEDTSQAALPEARDLSQWKELPEGDVIRGEAQAFADAALAGESPVAAFETTADYITVDAYAIGGKEPGNLLSRIPGPTPPQYAIIQVQEVVPVVALEEGDTCPPEARCIAFGETPPKAEARRGSPVVSVIMTRDLGAQRLPPALITLSSALMLGITCNALHRRDKMAEEHRRFATKS